MFFAKSGSAFKLVTFFAYSFSRTEYFYHNCHCFIPVFVRIKNKIFKQPFFFFYKIGEINT